MVKPKGDESHIAPIDGRDEAQAESDLFDLLGGDEEFADQQEDDESQSEDQDSDASDDDDGVGDEVGDEEAGEGEEDADDAEPGEGDQKFSVKVQGEDIEVTLDELRQGYSRTSDYTRKTQQLADERKTFADDRQAVQRARIEYGQQLQALAEVLQAAIPSEPDWNKLRADSPEEYSRVHAEWTQFQANLKAVQDKRQQVAVESQEDLQKQQTETIRVEQDRLGAAIPEWTDQDVQKADKQKLLEYAESFGYTKEELAVVIDHRAVVMLRKAMLYDEMSTKGKAAVAAKKKVAKILKPGQPKPKVKTSRKRAISAHKRLAKTGRVRDAAAVLLELEGAVDVD